MLQMIIAPFMSLIDPRTQQQKKERERERDKTSWKWQQMTAAIEKKKVSAAQIAGLCIHPPKLTDAVMRFQTREHWCIVTGHKADRVQRHYGSKKKKKKSSLWLMKQSPFEMAYKGLLRSSLACWGAYPTFSIRDKAELMRCKMLTFSPERFGIVQKREPRACQDGIKRKNYDHNIKS